MKIKDSFIHYNLYIYLFFLVLLSFSINQYYAYKGVLPVDSFSTFNAGFDILNGSYPFKDFWTIKGPVLDIIQSFFFKFLGVSWFSYATHSSTFNTIFALSTFFTLKKFDIDLRYCFTYSVLASILMYPTYGIPFTDHHVSIFSMLSVYCLILAIKTDENKYWFFIPLLLFLGFFTKQTPAAYFGLLISLISIIYLFQNFRKEIIFFGLAGVFISILLFFALILIYKIPISSIITQYFLFPMSLGETRLEWLLPFEFQRFVLRHKLIYIALAVPFFLLFKNIFKNFYSLFNKDNLIFFLLIGTLIIFVTHQLMTINGLFIFFLIPVFSAFSHIYSKKFKNKKNIYLFFLLLSFFSTIYYLQKYIDKRDTLILRDLNLKNSINASILGNELKNLKWITHHYPNNPSKEIKNLLDTIDKIKKDNRKKMLVTDYQFISVLLQINDNSAARIWWRHHIYPEPGKPYFANWKKFLLDKISKEKIEVIYTIHPLEGEKNIFDGLIKGSCYSNDYLNDILLVQNLKECKELKSIK